MDLDFSGIIMRNREGGLPTAIDITGLGLLKTQRPSQSSTQEMLARALSDLVASALSEPAEPR